MHYHLVEFSALHNLAKVNYENVPTNELHNWCKQGFGATEV